MQTLKAIVAAAKAKIVANPVKAVGIALAVGVLVGLIAC